MFIWSTPSHTPEGARQLLVRFFIYSICHSKPKPHKKRSVFGSFFSSLFTKRTRPPRKKIQKKTKRQKQKKSQRSAYDFLWPFEFIKTVLIETALAWKHHPWHLTLALSIGLIIMAGTQLLYTEIFQELPDVQELTRIQPPSSTKILDRNGEVIIPVVRRREPYHYSTL